MNSLIHLRGGGASLVLDGLEVLHWGAELPEDLDIASLRLATARAVPGAGSDARVRMTVVPCDSEGFTGRPGLAGHRGGNAWAPVFSQVSAEVTGGSATIAAADPLADLALQANLSLDEATGVLATSLELRNTGTEAYRLERLSITLPLPATAQEVLSFTGRWCGEWREQRHPLHQGALTQENRRGRTSHDSPPGLLVGEHGFGERHGETYGVQLAWSGNHGLRVEQLATGHCYLQADELLFPGEVELAPGASYTTPTLYAAYSAAGAAGITRAFHGLLRARPLRPRPVLVNTWEAVYFDHDAARLDALVDAAAEVGAERFVLDDGWFRGRDDDTAGLGDWYVDERKYPNGLGRLIDRVRAAGMEFGLWVEPEMVNPDSDLYRAHPDWALGVPGYPRPTARNQLVLNLANPAVTAYLLARLDALLSENDIAYLKWDMNRDLMQAPAHEQTWAYYRLLHDLRRRHPEVEIESCSSGGARADLGVLAFTQRIWTSDCNDALERQHIQRGFSYFLPPELMGAHIGPPRSHTTARVHSLQFRAITAFFGHLGVEWDLTAAPEADRRVIAEVIAEHKRLRPLLHGGEPVRVEHPDPAAVVHGVVGDGHALFSYAQVSSSAAAIPAPLRLPGLAPATSYDVRWLRLGESGFGPMKTPPPWLEKGITLTGAQLAAHGLALPVLHPEHALLIELTAH